MDRTNTPRARPPNSTRRDVRRFMALCLLGESGTFPPRAASGYVAWPPPMTRPWITRRPRPRQEQITLDTADLREAKPEEQKAPELARNLVDWLVVRERASRATLY